MHFHAEHPLFFERRRSLWQAAASLTLTVCVLILNAGTSNQALSLFGSGVGSLLLLVAYVRGQRRLEPALAWMLALAVCALLGGVALSLDMEAFAKTATRISCGVIWVLWLGTQLDWTSLRQILLTLRVPESVVASLDHALMHGVLTRSEWTRRRDAARLRLGAARLPLPSWGALIGEGALQAFLRLEHVEENALLRSSSNTGPDAEQATRLDSVDVVRGGRVVLEQLSLEVAAGECLLVCGPSGAGKSSLLRLLAGLDGPTKGTMTRLGSSVSPGTALRARLDGRVALLGQNPEQHFIASTVAEDIAWGLLHRGIEASRARTRALEIATALRIDHLMARPCHELSFGEQRRVALAGLLVLDPVFLLLDEPTAGLDPVAAHELRRLVEESIRQTGAACVWSTHDLHSLPSQAHRVVLLRSGRALFDGPATEGLSQPWLVRAGLAVAQEGEGSC